MLNRLLLFGISALVVVCVGAYATLSLAAFAGEDVGAPKVELTKEQIDAGQKHADFTALSQADGIVIGTATFRLEAVLESFPPHYQYRVTITPDEVPLGGFEVGKVITARYSVSQVKEPTLPSGKKCVVAFRGEAHKFIAFVKEVTDADLILAARVAGHLKTAGASASLDLAKKTPKEHPLFKKISAAEGVAILKPNPDPAGVVSFSPKDRLETHEVEVGLALKGGLKTAESHDLEFVVDGLKFPDNNQPFIALYSEKRGRPIVHEVIPMDEVGKLILTAAFEVDAAKLTEAAKPGVPRVKGDPNDGDAESGESAPGFPGVEPGIAPGSERGIEPGFDSSEELEIESEIDR